MCLSLTGCFSAKNAAIKKVTRLLEDGRYDEAIQVIGMMQMQSELTGDEALEQAPEQVPGDVQAPASFLGVWKNTKCNKTVEIRDDGMVILSELKNDGQVETYENEMEVLPQKDGGMRVSIGHNTYPKYMNLDGIDVLENYGDYFLREEDFDNMVEVVEITEENWERYFVFRLSSDKNYDQYGDVSSNNLSYGLFLRDEYVDRYYSSEDMSIELTYNSVTYAMEGDRKSEEIRLGEPESISDITHELEVRLEDRRMEENTKTQVSDYNGTVSDALGSNVMYQNGDEWSISLPNNFAFSRSTGSLIFVDERLVSMMLTQQ